MRQKCCLCCFVVEKHSLNIRRRRRQSSLLMVFCGSVGLPVSASLWLWPICPCRLQPFFTVRVDLMATMRWPYNGLKCHTAARQSPYGCRSRYPRQGKPPLQGQHTTNVQWTCDATNLRWPLSEFEVAATTMKVPYGRHKGASSSSCGHLIEFDLMNSMITVLSSYYFTTPTLWK